MVDFPIIGKLGGTIAVFDRLKAAGLVGTLKALQMWRRPERAVIPGDCARELMRMADERRVRYAAGDFTLPRPSGVGPARKRRAA